MQQRSNNQTLKNLILNVHSLKNNEEKLQNFHTKTMYCHMNYLFITSKNDHTLDNHKQHNKCSLYYNQINKVTSLQNFVQIDSMIVMFTIT